jgi:hypothetical protein
MQQMSDDIYVVVADNDQDVEFPSGTIYRDSGGPLVFEQYTRTADLESIKRRAQKVSVRHGKCRIAKLVFIEE